jgi:glycosyltransferase involved in cell wall biosynthesis
MSVGNAVVTAEGVENDMVINGKTALTVKFHDEQAMTDALEKLLKDHEYARSLGRSAQEYLRKHFLASRMIARLGKAYHQSLQVKNTSR